MAACGSYPGGSEWRRWDPHVHLPGTLFEDTFSGTLEAALDILSTKEPAVEVVGVTDYFTTSGYRKADAAWKKGSGLAIKYLYPNVELRLDISTKDDKPINIHLLCDATDVDELDRFLGLLEFEYANKTYRADRPGMIALGRQFRGDATLGDEAALRAGAHQFKVGFEAFKKKFVNDGWAASNCLIAVAGGQPDGTSGLQSKGGSFDAIRQNIEAAAHIIFSGNPKQASYWLGRGTVTIAKLNELYGGPKLCLHGSDAHNEASLGAPTSDRFCWVKGDPSFETLRMACLAPDSRALIGPLPPTEGYSQGRISAVSVEDSSWVSPSRILINPGLVAIIGGRGSGKTALADLIAAGAGSTEPFVNPLSFVRRAETVLEGSVVDVEWSHGETMRCEFPAQPEATRTRSVRYLSQQFVERLCSADGVSSDLLSEIERVVFNAWPIDDRLGATTFQELLDFRLRSAKAKEAAEVEAIREYGESITEQRILKASRPGKESELEPLKKQLGQAEAKTKELTSKGEKGNTDRLSELNQALEQRRQDLQNADRRVQGLETLESNIAVERDSNFPRITSGIRREHVAAGLSDDDWQQFRIDFVSDVSATVQKAFISAKKTHADIAGSSSQVGKEDVSKFNPTKLATQSVAVLSAEQRRIQSLVGLDARRTQQLEKLNQQTADFKAKIAKLEAEIVRSNEADARIDEFTTKRLERYSDYFSALLAEEEELRRLYAPLSDLLESGGSVVSKLKFSVQRVVDVHSWAIQGETLIDLRKGTKFRSGELERLATAELLPAWQNGQGGEAATAIEQFAQAHSKDIRKQSRVDPDEDLAAYREWERSVAKWMFGAEHVRLAYSLEYGNLKIERLSPGSRGIVLLLLYLAVDKEETDPLIIDQPEENLDPESVYTELVGLFRDASSRRQVIMVTHNPNLVVNTDVDQVIVARCESLEEGRLPELSYQSGGLENPEIRRAVCEVLEGGEEAFRQRAKRLRIDISSGKP